jgi:glycerate dehydrogenase
MKIVILDSGTLGADIDLEPIRALGDVIEYKQTLPGEIAERLTDADVAVLNKCKLNRENLADAKNLKLICVAATGYDNIDLPFCRERGIALCNVPGYSTDSVAQLSVSMALSLVTHLDEFRSFVHSGEYSRSGSANRLEPVYHEIAGQTWGVVGGGGIGSKVAEIAKALGCRVLLCRRKPEDRYEAADIDGANGIDKFRFITVPLLAPTTFFLTITGIISSFKVFGQVNVMTQGGPGSSTYTLVYYIYKSAFTYYSMGYASSVAVILFLMLLAVTLFQWKHNKEN